MNNTIDLCEANGIRYRVSKLGSAEAVVVVVEVTVGRYIYASSWATTYDHNRQTAEAVWRCDQSGFRLKRAIDEAGCPLHSASFNL